MTARVFVRGLRCLCAIVVALTMLVTGRSAHAQQLPGNARAVDGDHGLTVPDADGTTWQTAFKYLQDALDLASNPENGIAEIWVAMTDTAGPYRPDLGVGRTLGSRAHSFELVANVRVMGGFVGGETDADQRDPLLYETVLSGDLGSGPASYHVVSANHEVTTTAILDGFTIRDGRADDPTGPTGPNSLREGAGLHADCAHVIVMNCRFTNNFAGIDAGVDSVAGFGAAIHADASDTCITGGGGPGGTGQVSIYNCRFDHNEAYGSGGGGGAIHHEGPLLIVNSLFHDNLAKGEDSDEFPAGLGGAIFSEGVLDLVNCTFADNEATGTTDGTGTGRGGAIYSTVSLEGVNCILWANMESDEVDDTDWSDQFATIGAAAVFTYSAIQSAAGAYPGTGNLDPTLMALPGFAPGDYRLTVDSPCLNEGNTTLIETDYRDALDVDRDQDFDEPTPDLDALPRVRNLGVDIGAYELQCLPCAADFTGPAGPGNPDNNVDALDFLLLIAQWGSPCVGSCEADITGPSPLVPDGNVDALDFLLLIAQWGSPGNCACVLATPPPAAPMAGGDGADAEGSEAAGALTGEEWLLLLETIGGGGGEADEADGLCWLLHYLDYAHDGAAECAFDGCGGEDPLGRH